MNDALEKAKANFEQEIDQKPSLPELKEQKKPLCRQPLYWWWSVGIFIACFFIYAVSLHTVVGRWVIIFFVIHFIGMVINFLRLLWYLATKKDPTV